jgi:hypothetical protein
MADEFARQGPYSPFVGPRQKPALPMILSIPIYSLMVRYERFSKIDPQNGEFFDIKIFALKKVTKAN